MSFADVSPITAPPPSALSYPAVVGPTAPAQPHQGMIWLDNSAAPIVLKIYDNNVWTPVTSGGAQIKLFNLQDLKASGVLADRDALVYDATTGTWINEAVQARLPNWNSIAQYNVGDLVLYHGKIYRCALTGAGMEPNSPGHAAAWKNLTAAVREWQPGQDWDAGDIVSVGWNKSYFDGAPIHTAILARNGTSIWMANNHLSGSVPVVPGEPDSVSNVPPGQWRGSVYTKLPNGFWASHGSTVTGDDWIHLGSPGLVAAQTYQDIIDMNVPVVPGTVAVILSGIKKGNYYRYTNKPSAAGSEERLRGWELAAEAPNLIIGGTPSNPSGA